MKYVLFEDEEGRWHRSEMPDHADLSRPQDGLPADPPDLSAIDWDEVQKDLHNLLVKRGLFSVRDISREKSGLQNAIVLALSSKIVNLYRFREVSNE